MYSNVIFPTYLETNIFGYQKNHGKYPVYLRKAPGKNENLTILKSRADDETRAGDEGV